MSQDSRQPPLQRLTPAFRNVAVAVVLIVGCALRFFHLDAKIYWHDETYTSLRASGFTTSDMIDRLFDGHEAGIEELRKFQLPRPGPTLGDTVRSLASEDSEHPPMYFIAVNLWTKVAPASPKAVRALSAILGLAALPLIWWLARELFRSTSSAWAATALMAVSPFFVQYSQEARPYTLWACGILLSTASLLRALRLQSPGPWVLYTLSSAVAMNTHVLFALVLAAHVVYVGLLSWRTKSLPRAFALSLAAIGLSFGPWTAVIFRDFVRSYEANSWLRQPVDSAYLHDAWIRNSVAALLTSSIGEGPPGAMEWTAIAGVVVAFAALARFDRRAPGVLLVFFIAIVNASALVLPDVIFGGGRSTIVRYLVPYHLAVLLAVARAAGLAMESSRGFVRKASLTLAAALAIAIGVSSARAVAADRWSRDDGGHVTWEVVRRINAAHDPLLIVVDPWPTNVGDALALSHALDRRVRARFDATVEQIVIPPGARDLFLLSPLVAHREHIERITGHKLEEVSPAVWKIVRG